ncbi:DUF2076 domain-containing protein [Xenophilus aerolatus]|nr:DUF2076 domain-containing protein [Xenophilus aerolatus]
MTPQETQWLDDLLQRLAAVQGVQKDPQAVAMIRERLAGQPDAVYLLVQRALLLEHALADAQQQIAQLSQAQQQPAGGSFLGGAPGIDWGRAPQLQPQPYASQPTPAAGGYDGSERYAPGAPPARAAAPSWRERVFGAPAAAAAPAASNGPGLLGTAASAAAGVAGGMFLFNGIEHLLGGRGGSGGGGLFGGNQGGTPTVTENVTQNFFGDDGGGRSGAADSTLARDAGADWDGFDDGGSFDDGDNSIV